MRGGRKGSGVRLSWRVVDAGVTGQEAERGIQGGCPLGSGGLVTVGDG